MVGREGRKSENRADLDKSESQCCGQDRLDQVDIKRDVIRGILRARGSALDPYPVAAQYLHIYFLPFCLAAPCIAIRQFSPSLSATCFFEWICLPQLKTDRMIKN